jgi:hypothetical protein
VTRVDLVERLADLVGGGALSIEDARDGWPALCTVRVDATEVPVALYVSQVGLSHRDRNDVERRFQNPGSRRPIVRVPGRHLALVGLWEHDPYINVRRPIVVTADAERRVDRGTRWSAFASLATLDEAQLGGWATSTSTTGELIRCLLPPLLPAAIAADLNDADLDDARVRTAAAAAGILDTPSSDAPAAERARRAATALVRDARFARVVLDAYGRRCAMCGLGFPLVEAAHIYPASAPMSPDQPWNGIALCPNHHALFDRHLIAVHAESLRIAVHDVVREWARDDPAAAALLQTTNPVLAPAAYGAEPRPDMFRRRYAFYADNYDWVSWRR